MKLKSLVAVNFNFTGNSLAENMVMNMAVRIDDLESSLEYLENKFEKTEALLKAIGRFVELDTYENIHNDLVEIVRLHGNIYPNDEGYDIIMKWAQEFAPSRPKKLEGNEDD